MGTLAELSDASILENLRKGYERDLIYTNIGPTLVAVNPYKGVHCTMNERAPGILRTVREIYDEMLENKSSHSCVVTGESGAGKSESTRMFVNQLATMSVRRSAQYLTRDTSGHQFVLQDRIVQAAPILESFGNAKTVRNSNSSRFGKWIEIEIDYATGQPLSASIRNYLLEKSRIVRLGKGERNFHIFYQLLSDSERCARYQLPSTEPKAFKLLHEPEPVICDIDDASELDELCVAMETMGMPDEEQEYVFRSVAAVLHLGNLEIIQPTSSAPSTTSHFGYSDETLPCKFTPASIEALKWASEVFGLDHENLEHALTHRTLQTGGRELIVKPRSSNEVRTCLEAFVKFVYSALFEWITERVNLSLDGIADEIEQDTCADDNFQRYIESGTIGILDAFGFEIFETNSFEQLCINYCNEKMQLHFNRLVFEEEVNMYMLEGILSDEEAQEFSRSSASGIDECLNLLEGGRGFGIFALIDDELKIPNGSDLGLLRKLIAKHGGHPKFSQPSPPRGALARAKGKTTGYHNRFTIHHYAGPVTYSIVGFLEKSTDPIDVELQLLCAASRNDFFQSSFPTRDKILEQTRGRNGKKTLGTQFKEQLEFLSQIIFEEAKPHFIRCIKPNDESQADLWNGARVLEQIRYAGLLEASQVRAKGFSVQHTHAAFIDRFKKLFLSKHDRRLEIAKDETSENLQDLSKRLYSDLLSRSLLQAEGVRIGKTKVFFKESAWSQLKRAHTVILNESSTPFQALVRSWLVRRRLDKFRSEVDHLREELASAASMKDIGSLTDQLTLLQQSNLPAAHFVDTLADLAQELSSFVERNSTISKLHAALHGTSIETLRECTEECIRAGTSDEVIREAQQVLEQHEVLNDLLMRVKCYANLCYPTSSDDEKSIVEQARQARDVIEKVKAVERLENPLIDSLDTEAVVRTISARVDDIKTHCASLVIARYLRSVAKRRQVRDHFRRLSLTRLQLEVALDNRDERAIEGALIAMGDLQCGEHARHPHPLVKDAIAVRADLRITKLAALNQLERLTRKLERRIRHREQELEAELRSAGHTDPAVLDTVALSKVPTVAKRVEKRKSKRMRALSLLRSMPSFFHSHGKKSQVRKSELELLTQAVDKARSAGASEDDHEQMRDALELIRRLEILKVQRRSSLRLFSSQSLISLTANAPSRAAAMCIGEDVDFDAEVPEMHHPSSRSPSLRQEVTQDSRGAPGKRVDLSAEETASMRRLSRLEIMRAEEDSMMQSLLGCNSSESGIRVNLSGEDLTRFQNQTLRSQKKQDLCEVEHCDNVAIDEDDGFGTMTLDDDVDDVDGVDDIDDIDDVDDGFGGQFMGGITLSSKMPPNYHFRTESLNSEATGRDSDMDQSGPAEELGEQGAQDFGIHVLTEDVDSFQGSLRSPTSFAAKINEQLRRTLSVKKLVLSQKRSMEKASWSSKKLTKVQSCTNMEMIKHKAASPSVDKVDETPSLSELGLDLPDATSSAERAILERICRESDMRKVIQRRGWEARRGLTGCLAMPAVQESASNQEKENLVDQEESLGFQLFPGASKNATPNAADFSFSSMYSSKSAAIASVPTEAMQESRDHPSFHSELSDQTIPELVRRKRALQQKQRQHRQLMQQHLQGTSSLFSDTLAFCSPTTSASNSISSRASSNMSRSSVKAYTEHWEAIAYVSKNVVSSKTF